ncbi:CTP synthase (UTP-ammonia lyase) [Embleya sp. AB8]
MADQLDIVAGQGDLGGTMRLGLYTADLAEGTIAREVYGATQSEERHRHRYEVNNAYRAQLEETGLVFSGLSPDGRLVEYVELPREQHPYFIATQAHPELKSRPTRPHPPGGWPFLTPTRSRYPCAAELGSNPSAHKELGWHRRSESRP